MTTERTASGEGAPVAWVTAGEGDRRRHLATFGAGQWRALCGAAFATAADTRPVIPGRCFECLDVARQRGDLAIVTGPAE